MRPFGRAGPCIQLGNVSHPTHGAVHLQGEEPVPAAPTRIYSHLRMLPYFDRQVVGDRSPKEYLLFCPLFPSCFVHAGSWGIQMTSSRPIDPVQ